MTDYDSQSLTGLAFSVTVINMTIKRWTIFDLERREYLPKQFVFRKRAERVMNELIRDRTMFRAIARLKDDLDTEYALAAYETYELVELA